MRYKVVHFFTDLQDDNYAYHVGDIFPRDGVVVGQKRLEELSTSNNKQGVPLIEGIAKVSPLPSEPRDEGQPAKGPSKSSKGRKRKKKDNE